MASAVSLMSSLLPVVSSGKEFAQLPLESWLPGVKEITARHGIQAVSVVRFTAGVHPVFEVNEQYVVKLVQASSSQAARREIECLQWLACCGKVPLPRLVGSGRLEEWIYLVSTRLPGRPLSERWPHLNAAEQSNLAVKFGRTLAEFHRISLDGFAPAGPHWPSFVDQRTSIWERRHDVARLPVRLRESGPEYIGSSGLEKAEGPAVLLHGDLAPENCLVSHKEGEWQVSGVIDFGHALVGPAPFDLTAPTVLLAPGDRRIIGCFFEGYGLRGVEIAELRPQLMAYTLLHPMADLVQCLGLIPALTGSESWDKVAEAFWPDF